jgi:hypothetical protein
MVAVAEQPPAAKRARMDNVSENPVHMVAAGHIEADGTAVAAAAAAENVYEQALVEVRAKLAAKKIKIEGSCAELQSMGDSIRATREPELQAFMREHDDLVQEALQNLESLDDVWVRVRPRQALLHPDVAFDVGRISSQLEAACRFRPGSVNFPPKAGHEPS